MTEEKPAQAWPLGLRTGIGTTLGFGVVALVHDLFTIIRLPRPVTGIWIRFQHLFFDTFGTLGVGVIAGFVVAAGMTFVENERWSKQIRRFLRFVALSLGAILTAAILLQLVGYELDRISLSRFDGRFHKHFYILGALGLGLSVPGLYLLGAWGTRRHRALRVGLLFLGLTGLGMNLLHLADDYAGVHGGAAWLCATCMAMPLGFWAEIVASKWSRGKKRYIAGFAIVLSLFGLFVPPSVTVRGELFRAPAPIGAWIGATLWWPVPGKTLPPMPAEAASSPYFQSRKGLAPIPPTQPPLMSGKPPVVVLITIDATRADALEKAREDGFFPTLSKLKLEGAYFPRATSAGSQTAVALSTLFSGHYFSQLEWREFGRGSSRFLYPATDRNKRFPELLTAKGISTATIGSITFLSSEFGVVRGFSDETVIVKGRDHGAAQQVIPPLVTRLGKVKNEAFFGYVHLTEPHAPYDRAGTEGPLMKRYLEEIRLADKYVALVLDTLQKRFPSRGYLIVSSDHGEAFGEHGTTKHTKTLYEELLRVPLFIRGPGIAARTIEEHVSVIDLGPTILDLFGVDTPGDFMGQSLVPLLAGRNEHLARPIGAEGRLRRVLYWGDLKVIDDPRRKVVEVYDLQKDPRELRNLFDTDRERVLPALAALRGFFEAHRLRIDGYETPYKP
jgi:arylsulfatase A-like enzyme